MLAAATASLLVVLGLLPVYLFEMNDLDMVGRLGITLYFHTVPVITLSQYNVGI